MSPNLLKVSGNILSDVLNDIINWKTRKGNILPAEMKKSNDSGAEVLRTDFNIIKTSARFARFFSESTCRKL